MSIYGKSDHAILKEIAGKIKRRRLKQNITQQVLAEKVGLNRTTIRDAEQGKSFGVLTLIRIVRGLDALEELENFLQEPSISPLQMVKMKGNLRKRASSKRKLINKGESEW